MKVHIAYLAWNDVEVEVPEKWKKYMTLYDKDYEDLTEDEKDYLYNHDNLVDICEDILGIGIIDCDDVYIVEEDA